MLIATYGSLRKGCYNHSRFQFETLPAHGEARIPGFRLGLESGYPYPFAYKGHDDDSIVVEIYDVPRTLFAVLDRMEAGAGYLYEEVRTDGGILVGLWFRDCPDFLFEEIKIGDWKTHPECC